MIGRSRPAHAPAAPVGLRLATVAVLVGLLGAVLAMDPPAQTASARAHQPPVLVAPAAHVHARHAQPHAVRSPRQTSALTARGKQIKPGQLPARSQPWWLETHGSPWWLQTQINPWWLQTQIEPRPLPAPSTSAVAVSSLADSGIPTVAMAAYRRAARTADAAYPGCGLPWELLAAIGRVESDHGQFGGAVLLPNGTSTRKIIGIPLDGTHGALVRDTDHGRLDADPRYDHAVGPMQFIPSTWGRYGADGNGDGIADPFNIFDATLAAAHYLCAAGGDLRTTAGQVRAVLAYNHSSQYLALVLALESSYAHGGAVAISLANVNMPRVAPVNPGTPPAVRPAPRHHTVTKSAAPARTSSRPAPTTSVSSSTPSRPSSSSASSSNSPTGSASSSATSSSSPLPSPTPCSSATSSSSPLPSPTPSSSATSTGRSPAGSPDATAVRSGSSGSTTESGTPSPSPTSSATPTPTPTSSATPTPTPTRCH